MVIRLEIIDIKNIETSKTPHDVDVRKLYSFKHASIIHIELKAGESLKKHVTPVDVFFYVLEGEGEVEIGTELEKIKKDQLIFSPARIPHRLLNNSEKAFRFMVIKTPTPTEETKIL